MVNGTKLPVVQTIKDLGVLINSKLRFTDHCHRIVASAYQQINILFRCFSTANHKALLKGYISYVRPILEYASPVWNPFQKTNIVLLEKVQKYFTRRLYHRCNFPLTSYSNRLTFLKLNHLEDRRLRANLLLYYKIINGFTILDPNRFFTFSRQTNTRGHSYKLLTGLFKSDITKNLFFNRFDVIIAWNALPAGVVNAQTCCQFSRKLTQVNLSQFIHVSWFE